MCIKLPIYVHFIRKSRENLTPRVEVHERLDNGETRIISSQGAALSSSDCDISQVMSNVLHVEHNGMEMLEIDELAKIIEGVDAAVSSAASDYEWMFSDLIQSASQFNRFRWSGSISSQEAVSQLGSEQKKKDRPIIVKVPFPATDTAIDSLSLASPRHSGHCRAPTSALGVHDRACLKRDRRC
jgi:hypothetical protein